MKRRNVSRSGYFDLVETPIGRLCLVFSGPSLTAIHFEKPASLPRKSSTASARAKRELSEYFERRRKDFSLETLFLEGTDFERQVWEVLREIPYGETRTYKWIAEKIGKPRSSRAVGSALGKNPIPIIFPCHRIIESDGSLGGYSPGPELKRKLLDLEYYQGLSAE